MGEVVYTKHVLYLKRELNRVMDEFKFSQKLLLKRLSVYYRAILHSKSCRIHNYTFLAFSEKQ